MKFGVVSAFGGAQDYVAMAREAEETGRGGVFAWDDISDDRGDVFDPARTRTRRVRAEPGSSKSRWESDQSAETLRERIRRGPPHL